MQVINFPFKPGNSGGTLHWGLPQAPQGALLLPPLASGSKHTNAYSGGFARLNLSSTFTSGSLTATYLHAHNQSTERVQEMARVGVSRGRIGACLGFH